MNITKERRACTVPKGPGKCGRTLDENGVCRCCDRLRCGQCGQYVQNPTAARCKCGKGIRLRPKK